MIVRLAARGPAAAPGTWSSPGNGPATDREEHPVTTDLRTTAVRTVVVDIPADESLAFELALVDALALAVDIRAEVAAASRVHEL